MSITLRDVYYLTGLPILGSDIHFVIDLDTLSSPTIPTKGLTSFYKVISMWCYHTAKPTPQEYVSFLWVLICRFIFCPPSGKPSTEHLTLARALASGNSYALGAMFLGSLYYHLDKCVSEEPFSKIGGGTFFL